MVHLSSPPELPNYDNKFARLVELDLRIRFELGINQILNNTARVVGSYIVFRMTYVLPLSLLLPHVICSLRWHSTPMDTQVVAHRRNHTTVVLIAPCGQFRTTGDL